MSGSRRVTTLLRRILQGIAWVAGGLVALCVVLYLVILAINWRDREPSQTAQRFERLFNERPHVPDAENAYIYALGIYAAADQNPRALGARRAAWIQESTRHGKWVPSEDPAPKPPGLRENRDSRINEFVSACGAANPECARAMDDGERVLDVWSKAEPWLLERYRALLAHEKWLERGPYDWRAPLPSYELVIDGQRMLLLHAQRLARTGDRESVRSLLGEELRFWRMVLESSDILITKMIATAALNRHFEIGDVVFRELSGDTTNATPDEWRVALTDAERSMHRVLIGEWMFSSRMIRETPELGVEDENSFAEKVAWRVFRPLHKPQDSINGMAEKYARWAESLSVPLAEYEAALRKTSETDTPWSLYNPIGRLILGMGDWDMASYAARVSDIEGVRRAALLAVTLRADGVEPADVPAALATSSLRNPYDERPFEWDARQGAIVFEGLDRRERGRHFSRY